VIRAPISRRARSVSARRSTSARERASWSISSAFAIAIAAWSARALTRAISASPYAPTRGVYVPMAPKTRSPTIIGATMNERMPRVRTSRSAPSKWTKDGSLG
jgi:hypothetical protein